MLNRLLKKVIGAGVGRGRMAAAAVGLAVSLLLILTAIQVQVNYNYLLYNQANQDSVANFLVVSRQIDGNSTSNTLSPQEIERLAQQPFVDAVGRLTSSRFKVSAQGAGNLVPFYTDLFFESVPNAFLDVQSRDWQWQQGSNLVPLIIPTQFLDLYNFGFAPSQNLVQLTPAMVMAVPLAITITGSSGQAQFTGRVVGFSDRIASVLVPDNFLQWANSRYGTSAGTQPSRVVIRTSNPGNPQLVSYLQQNNLVTDADKTRFSKYRRIVDTVVNASWITGAVMLLFALLVFSLFIQLTISSARPDIELLVTLGASPRQLHRFLMKRFLPGQVFITCACLAVVAAAQWVVQAYLHKLGMHVSAVISIYTLLAAALLVLVMWWVNRHTIRRYVYAS